MERTLIILKPDAIQRRLIGRLIQRFEDKGLAVGGMKLMCISRELAERHYAPHKGKPFYPGLIDYITSGPVVVTVLQGERCIEIARTMMGKTFGYEAAPGTIRGAAALGWGEEVGSLSVGKVADLAVIPLVAGDKWESVLESTQTPVAVYIDGVRHNCA